MMAGDVPRQNCMNLCAYHKSHQVFTVIAIINLFLNTLERRRPWEKLDKIYFRGKLKSLKKGLEFSVGEGLKESLVRKGDWKLFNRPFSWLGGGWRGGPSCCF